jgi:arsenate reductase
MPVRPGLLFLCVANSARSQLAEGLARRRFGDALLVQSAGGYPSRVHPAALEVMAELGIDLSAHHSKDVDSIDPATVATVITLCAEEMCPSYLRSARRLHWPLPDPTAGLRPAADGTLDQGQLLDAFRATRDAIAELLERFHDDLLRSPTARG